ncbi:MAG TPA: DCC1-like thiol-disulfide oxidoreductase family protein [Fimbriimonadaceae bacterium]|nr:DCC1-like thiol-disulfide oxidoreductase family protein [Fimbriimonadaceae bacterium]
MSLVEAVESSPVKTDPYRGGDFLVLYDGVCGFCNRSVQFLLKRDRGGRFRYAPLQSRLAHEVLDRHGENADDLESFFLVIGPGTASERVLKKGRAVLHSLKVIGGVWKGLAFLVGVLPTGLLDWGYGQCAKRRYRFFGRLDACPIPKPEDRAKFLEL